jgi:predicted phosphatase
VRDKDSLTKTLIPELPEDQQLEFEEARCLWWHNIRSNGGMRLTTKGYYAFRALLNLSYYEFDIHDPLSFDQKMILAMDQKLQTPYYIQIIKKIPKKIIFFGSREAVMANLYGDLKKFLDNYRP